MIRKKVLSVEPFSKVLIGDPMYLTNMQTKKSTTKYIANFNKIPTNKRRAGVILVEEDNEDELFVKNRIIIYSLKDMLVSDIIVEMHTEDGYFKKLLNELRVLKNDKKQLLIQIDKKKHIMELNNDGDCGYIFTYGSNIGYVIEIVTKDIESYIDKNMKIISSLFSNISEKE